MILLMEQNLATYTIFTLVLSIEEKVLPANSLKKIMKSAKDIGVSEIHITTRFDNNPAINLYKKHGLIKEHLELEKEF